MTIDDRGFCFKGEFPTIEEIKNFKEMWSDNDKRNR